MKSILVIGSLNMDMVLHMEKIPLAGETVLGNGLRYSFGGKGANQAFAVASLGGRVEMLGRVGMDDFGTGLTRNLTSRGVRADRVTRHEKLETGMAVIYVEKSGNNSIVVAPGANQACDEAYLRANDEAFQRCDYILLQIEIPQEAVHYAIARGKELGKTVILNPAPAPASIPEDVLKDLDYIIPNETELAKLSRRDSTREIDEIEAGALSLTALGVRTVIVTLGHNGCMLVQGCNVERFPSIQVKAVDTTAAGDCFCAAFAVALSDGKSAPEAIAFANVAAGLSVTKPGAQDSIPAREEVLRRLRL